MSLFNQQAASGVDANGSDEAIENAYSDLSGRSQLSPTTSESSPLRLQLELHSASASSCVAEPPRVAPLSPVMDLLQPLACIDEHAINLLEPLTSTPISRPSAGYAKTHEALFSGSLADKPPTALPGIEGVAEALFRQRGIFTVQCLHCFIFDNIFQCA